MTSDIQGDGRCSGSSSSSSSSGSSAESGSSPDARPTATGTARAREAAESAAEGRDASAGRSGNEKAGEKADERWDVIVVGAGPAGSSAAREAALGGASVLLMDRARFPRYKTCGGGLIAASLDALPQGRIRHPPTVRRFAFSADGTRRRVHHARFPVLALVDRDGFDDENVRRAVESGAVFRDGCAVRALEDTDEGVRVVTTGGVLTASVVVGADGAGGRCGRFVGLVPERRDVGLETELDITPSRVDTLALDWRYDRGAYAWSFPKPDHTTLGTIDDAGHGAEGRDYLAAWTRDTRLQDARVLRSSGHITQWSAAGGPYRRGRVLLAGETAGLLEPWTREGISFALRSGAWAGTAAARAVTDPSSDSWEAAAGDYERRVLAELLPEIRAGRRVLALLERRGRGVIPLLTSTRAGFALFQRFCRGELTLARATAHPLFRLLEAVLRTDAGRPDRQEGEHPPRPVRSRLVGLGAARAVRAGGAALAHRGGSRRGRIRGGHAAGDGQALRRE